MFLISFVKIAVVSRLLDPSEIGTFTIAAALIFMAQFMRVFGTWEYIVAEKELTETKLRHCFTIVLMAGLLITGLYLLAAQPLARVFNAPDLILLIWIMVPSFLFLPVGTVTLALMQRDMQFMQLSVIRMSATVADTVLTIVLALWGAGVASLAWGYTLSNVISVLMLVLIARGGLLYRPLFSGLGTVLRFGWPAACGTFLSHIGTMGPPLVLGLGTNTAVVGVFGRGQTLITFFRQGIEFSTRPVTQAWFAQKSRNDPTAISQAYLRITAILSGVAWPVYVGLFFGAPTLVPFLLGDQWQDSIIVAQILAVGGLFSFYHSAGISLLEGLGLMGRRLRFNLVAQSIRFSLLALSLLYGGMLLFSVALASSHVVSFLLITLFLKTDTGLQFRKVAEVQIPSGLVAGTMVLVSLVMFGLLFEDMALSGLQFLLYFIVMFGVWVSMLATTDHPLWQEGKGILARRLTVNPQG